MNFPARDTRIPADMRAVASILDINYPAARCPRCQHKTRGRLYKAGGVRLCAACASELAKISGKQFKRAR